jgi:ribosome recycling factor
MIYEIDFSSMENKMKADLGRFSSLIKDIKFGKLTPETFQNILIHHYGKE